MLLLSLVEYQYLHPQIPSKNIFLETNWRRVVHVDVVVRCLVVQLDRDLWGSGHETKKYFDPKNFDWKSTRGGRKGWDKM